MTTVFRRGSRSAAFSLDGASVAVTGGANGIGRAISTHFARAGARVAIGDIDVDAARALADELGNGAVGIALDVSDEASFTAFLDAAEKANGPLAVLVNNAGIDWMGPFHTETNEVSRRQVAVNLIGPIVGSRLALERMLPRRTGHLVNVASAAGRIPQPGSAVYTATKHGVVGLTECLRLEYRDSGVRFSVLHPGYIPTGMTQGTHRPSRLIPAATPDDCARAVVDAVRHNRFEVWSPAGQWVSIKLGHLVGRAVRERVLMATGIGRIVDDMDQTARRDYNERAFGGKGSAAPVSVITPETRKNNRRRR
ncbi:SDR family oxidoreductase [Nocardia sp. NPDC059240]|uniref:SDR family oxidoreductase n=1 Tax=Nocardia sp. NPDC059240 TaxID=3346786 RepID=UPI003687050B